MMEQIMNYVKPELIVVAVVLYFVGAGLKKAETIADKYIPLILGGVGIVLCAIWVLATCPIDTGQNIAMAVFTAIVQGILVAGLSTYVNQIIKQAQKNRVDQGTGNRPILLRRRNGERKEKTIMAKKVIDVSHHNGTIDWESVKAAGIDGAIIRCGFGSDIASQDDEQFKRNADECTRLGIPFGVYIYSYAKTIAQAESEAQHVLRLIAGYKLSYPVYLDLEQAGTESGAIERANRFGDIIEAAGYWCGVYANKNWWDNYLVGLTRFTRWAARYNDTLGMDNVDIWQYTSGGTVAGISGSVDMNHCYRDFPAEIGGGSGSTSTGSGSAPSTGNGYTGDSIVDYLNSIGQDSSFSNRKKLAAQYGISNYTGTAAQNLDLLNKMRSGSAASSGVANSGSGYTGNSIVDYLNSIGKDSSFAARKQYAAQYGISGYTGTAAQNTLLLNLMRGGSAPAASSYYPAFSSSSIVDGLKSIGVDSSFSHRSKIAVANGIAGYSGTATQNNKLCSLAKQGKLKKA